MQQWEYHTTEVYDHNLGFAFSSTVNEALDKLGAQGWELVASIPRGNGALGLIFKRPKTELGKQAT